MQRESYLTFGHFDLVTPDGKITKIDNLTDNSKLVQVEIEHISDAFVGYHLEDRLVLFNLKSTLAQLGINAIKKSCSLDHKAAKAFITLELVGIGQIAKDLLNLIQVGSFIGKLFAADESRRVRNADYLLRMFGRSDRFGKPLLSLGGLDGSKDLVIESSGDRVVAYLSLKKGKVIYEDSIFGFLPTLAKSLKDPTLKLRGLLPLHQIWQENDPKMIQEHELLLVKTAPLHIRTAFGKVVDELLPKGFYHTAASILEPNTKASGDIYELYGNSDKEINDIPLEFYTLEPHREYIFFSDRDQLQVCLEDPSYLFKAFDSIPIPTHHHASIFIVKGEQLLNLKPSDWIEREPQTQEFPGVNNPARQALMAERYIQEQSAYPFLKAIEDGLITSQGILLTRYFPSPLLKRMLLSDQVQRHLKGIYFEHPSRSFGDYFSHEDRSMLLDLSKFGIPVYWLDRSTSKLLQYVPKPGKDAGMFVPMSQIETFTKATSFGIYGSNLMEMDFEVTLTKLLKGLQLLAFEFDHPLLNKSTPLALITGGGPGVMEMGNRVAKNLQILSCANIVDFRAHGHAVVNEQKQNPYIDAKMTYRLDRLVERQAEFNLDFPIFLTGGIGTDFEFCLEEVRRKVGASNQTPVLLFGTPEYWRAKITTRYQCNLESGTIAGSEWVSNCFFAVETAEQALSVYRKFFEGKLKIGKNFDSAPEGFVIPQ